MFEELAPLLKNRSLVLILTGIEDGRIRLNVIPKATSKDTEQDKPLLQPLTIEAEPLQLDEELPEALTSYTKAYQSIQESVDATKKAMADAKAADEAKRKAEADAKKNKTKHVPPAKPADAKPASPAAPGLFDAPATTTDDTEEEEETAEVFE